MWECAKRVLSYPWGCIINKMNYFGCKDPVLKTIIGYPKSCIHATNDLSKQTKIHLHFSQFMNTFHVHNHILCNVNRTTILRFEQSADGRVYRY